MKRLGTKRSSMAMGLASLGALAGLISGCSGSPSNSSSSSNGSSSSVSNVQPISVNIGPATGVGLEAINVAFTSVTVCVPGTTTCQTIPDILVDTGSPGLRILSSALTLSLPQQGGSSSPIEECGEFEDGETWGPVQSADIELAGEKASAMSIQVIGPTAPAVPAACSNQGPVLDTLSALGANGIIGVDNYIQDCATACTLSGSQNPGLYYTCPTSGCVVTTEPISSQVANPVAFFASDNNGVLIQLPSAPGITTSISGSMIFGIGTQSNNGLGSATVYNIDPATGNFTTTFQGITYTDAAFLDSGSNANYFLDTAATMPMLPTCSDYTFWYCPATTTNFSASVAGASNGHTGSFAFSVGSADALNSQANATAGVDGNLGGPNPGQFDWGLPFFYGRNVFTAIEGRSTPGGTGPYWAF